MDLIFRGECKCGYDTDDIYDEGGFFDGRRTPAVCKPCKKFFLFNYLEEQNKCSYCGKEVEFYMLEHILDAQDSDAPEEMPEFDMTKKYFCPGCGKNSLKFIEVDYGRGN